MSRNSIDNRARLRRALAGRGSCWVGAAVLALGATPAFAQDEPAAADENGDEVIVVTGSRLATTGMETPVPVTAVQADELEAMDPSSLIASVSQLPQFYGNQTPNNSAFFTRSGTGTLNLRGLGVNRTLTLLNGRRFPSSSAFGGVDVNVFPEAMIKGIETVTGGASAAYGTDAVAGVTNFLLDTEFEGLEASVQGGITSRGDNESFDAELAWGIRLGDRGHLLVSGAYAKTEGIHSYEGRDWYQSWGAIQVGGVWADYPNVVSSNGSFDGIIESPNALIDNLQFRPDGSYAPFVLGAPSTGAVDYVLGNDPGVSISTPLYFANLGLTGETLDYTTTDAKRHITTFDQHLAEISARGDLFDNWAGTVSMALGASWRKESIYQVVQDQANQQSNHDGAYHPCSLATAATLGLRGLSAPDCNNTVAHQFSKVSNIQGKTTVKEAFGEVLFPLVRDLPWMQSAVLNVAGRWADYSGAGTIWAYKGGLDLQITDEFRVRGTYSRDVRAGNLSERFDKTGGAGNVLDTRITAADTAACQIATPALNCTNTYNVTIFSGGNPNIQPEEADTFTAGVVIQPTSMPGFSASVDWFQVKIDDAIATVGTNEVARRCLQDQEQLFCDLITFEGTTDAGAYPKMILVGNQFVNVAQSRVEGIDVELGYRSNLSLFGGDEAISTRLFGTVLIDRSDIGATGAETRFSGLTGLAPDTGGPGQFPTFKATGNLTYSNGPFRAFFQGRLIGSGRRAHRIGGANAVEGLNIADNSVPAVFYLDTRLSYELEIGSSDVEVFVAATNLLDKDPPVTATYSAFLGYSGQVNTQLFDVLGRRFTAGVKFKL